jgi:DNA-binding NtrC family response regulator
MQSLLTEPEHKLEPAPEGLAGGLALVVLWAPQEPRLLGACLLPPSGGPSVFGRGDSPPERGHPRLLLRQQRPGGAAFLAPVENAHLSRSQLILTPRDGALEVENTGLCPLLWRGQETRGGELQEGEVIALGQQMVFLCTPRPLVLPGGLPSDPHDFGQADALGVVGEAPAAWVLRQAIAFLAQREEHALILGPSGCGKELVAQALHALSRRRSQPLVSRNAATIPEALVDAELFGNAKNYPNPGMVERPGLIGQAHQSTLFLDEFAELPQSLQAHLLRVLDAGEYQRLGEASTRRSDLRLLAASNRPLSALKEDVAARFFHRLQVPGLNERREDIPLLVVHLLRRVGLRDPSAVQRFFPAGDLAAAPRIARDFLLALVQHTYTTHIRELLAFLWESVRQSHGDELALPPGLLPWPTGPATSPSTPEPAPPELSAEFLQRTLDEHNGSIEKTWRAVGLPNRYALRRLIQKHALEIRRRPGSPHEDP